MPRKRVRGRVRVNRWLDWGERTFWSFVNTWLGLLTASEFVPHVNVSTLHQVETAALAAGFTTVKVVVAQRAGPNDLGAAIPGQVVEGE